MGEGAADERARILIVDDDDGTRESLTLVLAEKGYGIDGVATGQEAVEKAREQVFDVAVVDVNLPDMDGLELFKPLMEMHPDMAVIVATGHATLETAVRALNEGASAYILKPLDTDQILARIERVVQMQRLAADNRRLFGRLRQELVEREQAEKELRQLEEFNEGIVQGVAESLLVEDADGVITFVNPAMERLLGYGADELVGVRWEKIVPEAEREPIQATTSERRSGVSARYETRLLSKEGRTIPVWVSARPIFDEETFAGVVSAFTDITELKRVQTEQAESEERYRFLIENQGEGITLVDRKERFIYCNPVADEIYGVAAGALVGRNLREFMSPETFELILQQTEKRRAGERSSYELEILRPDGDRRQLLITVTPWLDEDGEFAGSFGVVRDITERKRAAEALRESEGLLRKIIDANPNGVFVVDRDGQYVLANAAFAELYDMAPEEMVGKTLLDLAQMGRVAAEAAERFMAEDAAVIESGEAMFMPEDRFSRLDGTVVWNQTTKVPLTVTGIPDSVLGVVVDITERKRLEEESEQRRLYLESVLANTPDAIVTLDHEHRILEWNRGAEGLFGYTPEEAVGHNIDDLITGADACTLEQATGFSQQVLAGEPLPPTEVVRYRKDGSPGDVIAAGAPIRQGDELIGVVAAYTDVSERNQAEIEAARRQELLVALGRASEMVQQARTPDEVYGTVGEQIRGLGYDAIVMTLAEDRKHLAVSHFTMESRAVEQAEKLVGSSWRDLKIPLRPGFALTDVVETGEPSFTEAVSELAANTVPKIVRPLVGRMIESLGVRQTISAPLKTGEKTLGVLSVTGERLTRGDIPAITAFANQAAIALENARLYDQAQEEIDERKQAEDELRRRTEQLGLLYEAGRELGRTLDLQDIYDTLYELVSQTMACDGMFVSSYEAADSLIRCTYAKHGSRRLDVARFPPLPLGLEGRGSQGTVIRTGQSVLVRDYEARARRPGVKSMSDVEEGEASGEELQIRSMIIVPLKLEERVVGMVRVFSERLDVYTEGDLLMLEGLALQVAAAAANAVLYRQAQDEIAERWRAEESLRESEERFRSVVQTAGDAIIVTDSQGKTVLWSRGAEAMFGYSSDEVLGEPLTLVIPERFRNTYADAMGRAASSSPEIAAVGTTELTGLRKDGSEFPTELSLATWHTKEGTFITSVVRDVSERTEAEEAREGLETQLRQAQKLQAVGLLAGGVAHEFNNLLTVMLGNAEMGMDQLEPGHAARADLAIIEKSARRAADLTQQLLAFSRRQVLQLRELDVSELVRAFASMLQRMIGEHIELQLDLAPGLDHVLGDGHAIEQVLMNLALNARDAMPEGGTLRLETAQVTVDKSYCDAHSEAQVGEYVSIRVVDTGGGMDQATREHIFEPFFTTKEVGEGTGLGLAVVHGIVRQHGGWIEVESEVGQGTTFDAYYPVHRVEVVKIGEESAADRAAQSVPGGTETILLAEDEQDVREYAQRVLEILGYKILAAGDGEEALEVFEGHAHEVRLVILDLVMPKLSGQKVYAAIRDLGAEVPGLFITGYSAEMMGFRPDAEGGLALLEKPFSMVELGRKVREMLDAARAEDAGGRA